MKSLWLVAGLVVCSVWAENVPAAPSPLSSDTPAGKPVYLPLAPAVDPKTEKAIQQEEGVIGGRNEPMHSYASPPKSDDLHKGH